MSLAARALLFSVRAYQAFFSALMPSACKFYPSCSHYAADAVRIHGARRGSWLALRRVSRCHPFTPGGVDLVPDAADFPRTAKSSTGTLPVRSTKHFAHPPKQSIAKSAQAECLCYFFRSLFSLCGFASRSKKTPRTEVCATKEVHP
jgi:hypothetical protein